ncbi:hypothetical protein GCM10009634_86210 [Saccharothrix xinjiangensis]
MEASRRGRLHDVQRGESLMDAFDVEPFEEITPTEPEAVPLTVTVTLVASDVDDQPEE